MEVCLPISIMCTYPNHSDTVTNYIASVTLPAVAIKDLSTFIPALMAHTATNTSAASTSLLCNLILTQSMLGNNPSVKIHSGTIPHPTPVESAVVITTAKHRQHHFSIRAAIAVYTLWPPFLCPPLPYDALLFCTFDSQKSYSCCLFSGWF